MQRRLSPLLLGALGSLLTAAPAFAQSLIPSNTVGSCNFATGQFGAQCVIDYLKFVLELIFSLTGAIFLIMIIIGGYQYALGSANVGSKEEGIAKIRLAIVGFIVAGTAFSIVTFVLFTLGG